MKFLVTGGAGFIGSALMRHLVLEAGQEALCYDKLTYAGHLESLGALADDPRCTVVQGDIADAKRLRAALRGFAPERIIHLAAESHVDRSLDAPADFIQTNIAGTFTLLEEALAYWQAARPKGFLFHQVSTDEVYGSLPGQGRFTEASPYAPRSPYSASKAASDHLVRAWGATYGLPYVVSNCSNNYGPRQFPEKLIPLTVLNALAGRPLPVYGDGSQVRDWLYVEEHARGLHLVATQGKPGETYHLGGACEKTNLEVVKAICAALAALKPPAKGQDYQSLITFVEDRPGHDQRYAMDIAKIGRELGWRPAVAFAEGLKRTLRWYLDNQDWCQAVKRGYRDWQRQGLARAPR